MGIYYYAIDHQEKVYFSSPDGFAIKNPGIYHPKNPFPQMLVMKNVQGYSFDIENDVSNDIPPSSSYKDITEEVYEKFLQVYPWAKEFYERDDEDNL